MSTTIKLRRGTSTAFSTNNPTLQAGEPAFETDTGKLKIGDGTTAYNSLAYIGDGLKNNTTATNSLAILGTTSGGNNTIIGSGSSCSARTNSTIIGASSSATSGNGNILVGYNNTTGNSDVIIIGNNVSVSGSSSCVRIGSNSNMSSSADGIAIGYGAGCTNASHGVAIGYNAKAQNSNAIQLGQGSNTTASTLQFMTYQLVNSSGKIPNNRLNIDSTPTSGSSNTVSSDGVYTALAGKADSSTTLSGYGITDGADTDLSNVTDTGYIKMAGASMPSNTYDDLTLGASGSTYTAPADGWFVLDKTTNGENQRFGFYNSALGLSTNAFCPVSGNAIRTFVPAKKGEQYIVTYDAGGTTNYFRFIYAQGSESEAN